jgi:hypothetical protein
MDQPPAVTQLVELRSYALVPGAATAFAEHFEARFLASQEDLGMDIVGQFTVPGDDARFVWIRRYLDPSARAEALTRFYTGPVWKQHGPRANELLVDHTDVHLLVPHPSAPAFAADHVPHARRDGAGEAGDGEPATVVVALYDLEAAELPADAMTAALSDSISERGRLVTAGVPNDFPALAVHEDVTVGTWLLADRSSGTAAEAAARSVAESQALPVRVMRLTPTIRSTIR